MPEKEFADTTSQEYSINVRHSGSSEDESTPGGLARPLRWAMLLRALCPFLHKRLETLLFDPANRAQSLRREGFVIVLLL